LPAATLDHDETNALRTDELAARRTARKLA